MTAALARLTWTDVVNAVAHEFGLWFTDYEANALLWEHTGFPGFFMGDPVTIASQQLRDYFGRRP